MIVCKAHLQELTFLPANGESLATGRGSVHLSLGLPGESSMIASPKLEQGPALSREHADGCSSWDRWTHGPKVKAPRVSYSGPSTSCRSGHLVEYNH